MRRLLAISAGLSIALSAALLAACSAAPPASPASAAPSSAASAAGGTQVVRIDSGGMERSYRLHVPARLSGPAPLVLMLHGGYGSGAQAERTYGWDRLSDSQHVVVAYPDGAGAAWNAGGGCCGRPAATDVDDLAFLSGVVRDIEGRIPIDPDRIYATGMSNGAMMSYRLACDTTLFAAVGSVSGTLLGDCSAPRPISVIEVHGTADQRIRYDGTPSVVGAAHIDGPPIPELMSTWRTIDGCPAPAQTQEGAVQISLAECPNGLAVQLVTIVGAGHEWPSTSPSGGRSPLGDPVYTGWDATTQLWAFFAAHPRR